MEAGQRMRSLLTCGTCALPPNQRSWLQLMSQRHSAPVVTPFGWQVLEDNCTSTQALELTILNTYQALLPTPDHHIQWHKPPAKGGGSRGWNPAHKSTQQTSHLAGTAPVQEGRIFLLCTKALQEQVMSTYSPHASRRTNTMKQKPMKASVDCGQWMQPGDCLCLQLWQVASGTHAQKSWVQFFSQLEMQGPSWLWSDLGN